MDIVALSTQHLLSTIVPSIQTLRDVHAKIYFVTSPNDLLNFITSPDVCVPVTETNENHTNTVHSPQRRRRYTQEDWLEIAAQSCNPNYVKSSQNSKKKNSFVAYRGDHSIRTLHWIHKQEQDSDPTLPVGPVLETFILELYVNCNFHTMIITLLSTKLLLYHLITRSSTKLIL